MSRRRESEEDRERGPTIQRTCAYDLPDDTNPRFQIIVEQSGADPFRPLLPDNIEENMNALDRKSAACYAELEEVTFQLFKIANQLKARGK